MNLMPSQASSFAPSAQAPGFVWPIRVYWEDTDGGGIVYYANYLKFLERARTEWLRGCGWAQSQLAAESGVTFTVVHVDVDYVRPARLDDQLLITCQAQRDGGATLKFIQSVHRDSLDSPPLANARVRIACVDAKSLRPRRLPKQLAATLGSVE